MTTYYNPIITNDELVSKMEQGIKDKEFIINVAQEVENELLELSKDVPESPDTGNPVPESPDTGNLVPSIKKFEGQALKNEIRRTVNWIHQYGYYHQIVPVEEEKDYQEEYKDIDHIFAAAIIHFGPNQTRLGHYRDVEKTKVELAYLQKKLDELKNPKPKVSVVTDSVAPMTPKPKPKPKPKTTPSWQIVLVVILGLLFIGFTIYLLVA